MQYNTTRSITENQDNKTLKDMTKSGKQRPWREKKIDNVSYADILEILKIKKAFNVKQCGNILEFKPTDEGYLKLHKTWFCKSKLCPVCNWRRAMKNSYQAQKVIEEVIKEKPKARWLFLTLSTKNAIDGDTLEQSLKHLTKAFDRLSRYKRLNKILLDLCVQQKLPLIKMTVVIISICTFCYVLKMHILEKKKLYNSRRMG